MSPAVEATVLSKDGKQAGKVALPEAVFGLKPRIGVLHEAITASLANRRSGTHETKTRANVSGGGRKPWKQKHTGRARAGSSRSPLWVGGGITFGPHPRSYRINLPVKKRRLALRMALSDRASSGRLKVIEDFDVSEPKTRKVVELIKALSLPSGALVIVKEASDNLKKASRNIPSLTVCRRAELNVYDVLSHDFILITRPALEQPWN